MTETKYCMGCMQPLSWDGRCRFCDFTEAEYECDRSYLPLHSTLKNGSYLIGRVLGKGGFGITYIGLDTTLLQRVAIKEFYPEQLVKRRDQDESREVVPIRDKQREFFERGMDSFLQEGRTLAKFSSLSTVAGVKTFLRENGTAYLVMEYVDGRSVKDYVSTFDVMNPDRVLSMIKPMIRDLQCIHEEHIFHRDISADNLIINDTNGKLTLIDFGAAKQILADNERTNTILYKPGYSALEQYSAGGMQGAWTDVYGLCASVYYMLTGIVPKSAMERIVDDTMQSLCDMEEIELSAEIKSAIWRGMAVERKDRCQSMAELYQALFGEQISEALPVAAREGLVPGKKIFYRSREKVLSHTRMQRQLMEVSRKRQRRIWQRRWMLGLAGVMLLALVILLWQAAHGGISFGTNQTGKPSEGVTHSEISVEKTEEPMPEVTQTFVPMISGDADQTTEMAGKQTPKIKEKQTVKPKKTPKSTSNKKQTPKPKTKQTPKPDKHENTPSLRLQEDDHVAGDLE